MATVKPQYVNAGAYGCVFEPHLPCELGLSASDPRAKKTIGKIMGDAGDAKTEWDAHQSVRLVDPNNEFTVKAHGMCGQYRLSDVDAKELQKCVLLDSTSADRENTGAQIIYEYGGKTLTSFLMSFVDAPMPMDTFVRLFFKFGNLFYGAMLLNNNKSIHFDIKSENVLIDDDMNLKLIDFGLLTRQEDLKNNELIAFSYRYFPPELRIYSHMTRHMPRELTPYEVLQEYVSDGGYQFLQKSNVFDPEEDINQIFGMTPDVIMTFSQRRVDVFALGWLMCLVAFCADNMSVDNGFAADIKFPLMSFIRSTARFHPEHRSTPEEAFAYHNMVCTYFANSSVLHKKTLMSSSSTRPSDKDKAETKSNKKKKNP